MPPVKAKTETKPAAAVAKNGKPAKAVKQEILYPEIEVRKFIGEKALTDDLAKKFLGWTEIPEAGQVKEVTIKDRHGKTIMMKANLSNRPLEEHLIKMYIQLMGNRQWKGRNGEVMIVGRTGACISLQHRLLAFIFLCQEWELDKDKWPLWENRPTLECLIVFGADDDDETINTVDTGRPRSFGDAICRSPYFAHLDPVKKEKRSYMLEKAVQVVEHRTGARDDAYSPKRPHAEGFAFISRHMSLIKCVTHIHEEDGTKKGIGYYLPSGYAAGLMYLFSAGTSDGLKYKSAGRDESSANLSNFDIACDFFVELSQNHQNLKAVKEYVSDILSTHGKISRNEAIGILIKAWLLWSSKEKVTRAGIELEYKIAEGERRLADFPKCGGIDLGELDLLAAMNDASDDDADDPTPEEIEDRKEQARVERDKKKSLKNWKPKAGDMVTVHEDGGEWSGEITELYSTPEGLVGKVKQGKNVYEAKVTNMVPAQ